MLIILLISQIVANSWIIYLLFRLLPKESQKEVLSQVSKSKAEVLEWTPPKSEEKVAEEQVMNNLKL